MPSCTFARVCSLTARIVPSISAVSGITLFVVPAVIRPTVTTDGSNTSIERVIISCSACTISQATGIGSSARCGSLACPPLPVTRMIIESADAMIAPPRVLTQPDGIAEVMCKRERRVDRRRRAVRQRRDVEQPLVEHEPRAVVALLAGLEHEQHAAGEARRGGRSAGAPRRTSIAVCVS